MAKYRVMCVKYGWAVVEAKSESDALESAENMKDRDFDWSDPDDHQIVEELDENGNPFNGLEVTK